MRKEKGGPQEMKRNPMYWLRKVTNKHWKTKPTKKLDSSVIRFLKSELASLAK